MKKPGNTQAQADPRAVTGKEARRVLKAVKSGRAVTNPKARAFGKEVVKRIGRPPKGDDAASVILALRFKPAEVKAIKAAAKLEGVPPATWMQRTLKVEAAKWKNALAARRFCDNALRKATAGANVSGSICLARWGAFAREPRAKPGVQDERASEDRTCA